MYDQAIQEYKIALQADPQNDTVLVDIGTAYQAKEDYDSALAAYQAALRLNANNTAAQQGIQTATAAKQDKLITQSTEAGGQLFKQGRYDEAIQKYLAVLQVNPKDAATHFDLGATYQAKKDYDNAIDEYQKAIALDGDNQSYQKALEGAKDAKAQPIIDAAIKKHAAKDYAGAIALYQQALTMRPNNASLWYDLASAQYASQDYLSARESYQKALAADRKGQIDDLYLIATIDENYGKGAQALSEYQKYLNDAPSGRYAQAARDRAQALGKDTNSVVRIKSEAELASIKQAEDAYSQAVSLQSQKNYDAALPLYQKAIGLQPQDADYVYGLGTLYQVMNNMDLAVDQYQKAIALAPNNKEFKAALDTAIGASVDPIIDQAVQKQTKGDVVGAIALYRQALAKAPNTARAHSDLGTALQQTDDFQGARSEYAKGYELDARDEVNDLYLMAVVDENYNQGGKALSEYQRYLKEAPSGQYAQQAKSRVIALTKNVADTQKIATQAEAKSAQEAEDAYAQAVKLQEAGKNDEAIPLYQKAISAQPNQDAYAYALGTCYQAKGDFDNATVWYKKAVSLAPQNKDYRKVLAAAQSQQTAPIMDQAVKKHEAGDYAAAIVLYKQALGADPDNAHGWTNLAGAYQASDDFANARMAYQKAFDLDHKGEVDDLYFIGSLDETLGQGTKAREDYQQYVQANPHGQYAAQAQARISVLKVDPSKTQKITTAAETKKSSEAQDAYNEGIKLQQDNKFDDAIAAYKKALSVSPNEAAYLYALGTAYQAKNDLDSALENYKRALSLSPREAAYKQAIRMVAQAKAAPLVNSAIEKQTKKNDIPGAIADYEAALKIDPDDAGTHMNLGTAYQAANKLPQAAAEYRKAIQLDPKNADVHYFLGTVLETTNQKGQAIQEYEGYLRLAPSGSYAADVRARLKVLRGR